MAIRRRDGSTFIYSLAEPTTGAVRYIGKADDPVARLRHHMVDKSSTHRARWIRQLRAGGGKPLLAVLEECQMSGWEDAERRWIQHFRDAGVPLMNRTDGGEGGPGGNILSADARARISAAMQGRTPWNKGILHSAETRARISAALVGKPNLNKGRPRLAVLQETRRKMSAAHVGRLVSDETRRKLSLAALGNKGRSGQHLTEEHRSRLAVAVSAAWTPERRAALAARNKATGGQR